VKSNLLSDEFLALTLEIGVNVLKVLLYNERKKTATLKVEINDKNAVLKCISNDSPRLEKERFKNEKLFYLNKKVFDLTPKHLEQGHNYLLIEYIKGSTLRERIISNLNEKSLVREKEEFSLFLKSQGIELIEQYKVVIKESVNNSEINPTSATEKLMRLYANLASSGPHSTSRSKASRLINRIFYYLSKRKVKNKVESILINNRSLLKLGFTHGDLHLDNIVVCSYSDKPYIIDLANSENRGLVVYDLIYFFSTLLTLLDANKQLKEYVIKSYEEKLGDTLKFTLQIALLFHHVSKLNSRFNSVAKKSQILKSYLNFFTSLNNELKSARG